MDQTDSYQRGAGTGSDQPKSTCAEFMGTDSNVVRARKGGGWVEGPKEGYGGHL